MRSNPLLAKYILHYSLHTHLPQKKLHFWLAFQGKQNMAALSSTGLLQPPSETTSPQQQEATPVSPQPKTTAPLPLREIPGSYGLPFIGPIKDRLDYFYNQGEVQFFSTRAQKYKSTVFRSNMPPGPFISSNSKVIVMLDGNSFPVLFDISKVEKKNLFTGTYMPSTKLTGGYRILSYLDPSEPKHTKLKNLLFFLLSNRKDHVIPEFHKSYTELFDSIDKEIAAKGRVTFDQDGAAFRFLGRAYYGADPADSSLGQDGPTLINKWVLFSLHPIASLGLPKFIEDPLLHTFPFPPCFVQKDYRKLYDFINANSTFVLDEAERNGIPRDEAAHNLVFATCFNTFGGIKVLFPNLMKWIGQAGVELHKKLVQEIRSAIESAGGTLTTQALENMPLTKSVVYETLRIEPPVPYQYGKAKIDLTIESHDARFEVKKGEMLFGYQPFATRDPEIFERPEEFVPDRFVGGGEELLKYVLWSNGPETESPTVNNKQCPGKDFIGFISRLFVVEIFRRYDTFEIEVVKVTALGSTIDITSLTEASS
ncbi:allene oxide synthase-like [Coffea arabica]|uniref:Allene oxide synthase-like n=1 Tax=Coffea arabica TaxID=13443 RepID=A0A6P6UPM9_COFAR|nr:allene oxide synthase-like [Coffea arabica]